MADSAPYISVVIPTYNRENLLRYTLESLRKQNLPTRYFEVIVVDDGGSDNSEKIVLEYKSFLNIQYFWQKDHGFRAGKARNIGTMIADGDYILYIDAGVLLSSGALKRHYETHIKSNYPTVIIGYVFGFGVEHNNGAKIIEQLDFTDVDHSILKLKKLGVNDIRQVQYDELGTKLHCWPAPFDIFWTCHVSAERNELIKAGLFDESFNTWGGEDVDLGIRLHMNNNFFMMNPDACSIHWPHKKQVENHSDNSKNAAMRIHEKYELWTTSFYGVDINGENYPLNKIISLLKHEGH